MYYTHTLITLCSIYAYVFIFIFIPLPPLTAHSLVLVPIITFLLSAIPLRFRETITIDSLFPFIFLFSMYLYHKSHRN
jgi:hypothetical protein